MKLWFRLAGLIFVVCFACITMAPANAQSVSLREAVNLVTAKYKGKVLKTGQVNIKQQKYYRIKLVTSKSRVISVLVNVDTGKVKKE